MKRIISVILPLVLALFVFTACDTPQSDNPNNEKKYTIELVFEKQVDDGNHNAEVKLKKVVFEGDDTLSDTVNSIIYEPFYSRYVEYSESTPVDFNFFRAENMIYESDELLSVAALSYRQGTYVVFPNITGVVVDLKNSKILTTEEILKAFDTSYADVFEEVRRILPEKYETTSPMIICDMIGTYLNSSGDLITIFSTDHLNVDMPANPTLYYNVTTKAICTHPSAESFEELEALFSSLPDDYVFDQEKYDEYYASYDEQTKRISKYTLDVSEIKEELAIELKDSYAPGEEVTVTIGTVTETNQYLWVNDEKLNPTDRNLLHTTFTFVMPDRNVKLKIEKESVDIPLPPDNADGEWYHGFSNEKGYQFYRLSFDSKDQTMNFDYGYYESEYVNRYTGNYTVDSTSQEIAAVLHDSSVVHSDPDITLKFRLSHSENSHENILIWNVLSCNVEKYDSLVGNSVEFVKNMPSIIELSAVTDGEFRVYTIPQDGDSSLMIRVPKKWYWEDDYSFIEDYDGSSAYPTVKRVAFRKTTQNLQEFTDELRATEPGYTQYNMDNPFNGETDAGDSYVGYYGDGEQIKGLRHRRYLFYVSTDADAYVVEVWQYPDLDGEDFVDKILYPIVKSFDIRDNNV